MKQFYKYILTLVVVLLTTTPAWAATYYAKAIAYSSPENCGYVWVTINNSSFDESQFSQKVMDSSNNDKYVVAWENHATFTAKYYAKPIDGYKFIGWYDENGAVKSTSTNNNCYHSFSFDATSKDKNNRTTVYRYAYFVKYNPSVTVIDFGEVAYNSGTKTQTFTIDCHNVGTWNTNQTIEQGPFTITFSNRKNDDTEHIVTANVALKTTSSGNYEENLSIKTTKGGTITIKLKANINATPTYTWNPNYWNADGTQKRVVHVDDIINDVVNSTSNGAITYSYELTNPSANNNGAINDSKFINNTATCGKAGLLRLTINQAAEPNGYNAGSDTRTILIEKYDITASINPDNAVWNQLVTPNPFSASTQHKFSGATSAVTDFTVTQQGNEHIALMDANTRNIQTYYTNGTVDFLITRDADYKYNALYQILTLHVNQSTENCPVLEDNNKREWGTINNSGSYTISSGTPDSLFFQARRTDIAGFTNNDYFYAEYSTDNNTWNEATKINLPDRGTWYDLKCDIPKTAKYVRFVTYTGATGNRHIRNVRITRKQDLQASTTSLTLDTTAINLPVSKSFTLDWSTCSDEIILTHNNRRFSLNTYKIDASDVKQGTTTITVTCDAEVVDHHKDTIIIYDQSRSISIPIKCLVNDKSIAEIKGATSHSMQVDGIWETGFEFIKTSYDVPTNNTADYFYYTISNNFGTNTYRKEGYPYDVITFDPETKKVYAHNAGTAVLTIIQQENAYHYTDTLTCTITVAKHTPEFTWKDPVYFNKTIADYFTTNNTDTEISITQPSTDPDVAVLYFDPNNANDKHTLDLTTYYKETTPASSTTVTVAQAEDYYWYAHSEQHTITPINEDNHVQFTLTQENYIPAFKHSFVDPAANDQSKGPDWQSGGIYFGGEGALEGDEGWNWNEKYYIIQFTGIPDSIYFDASRSSAATGTIKLSVSEGKTPDNLTEVWSNSNNTANNNIIRKLNPDSRYLKFSYTGNLWGLFKNITVTELNEFYAIPDTLNFGRQFVDNPDTTLTFDFKFANAGYKVQLESTDPFFTIETTHIDTIGGEKHGTVKGLKVTYHPTRVHNTNATGAKILIWDEVGHRDTVHLVANTIKSKPELHWTEAWKAEKPIVLLNQTVTDAAESTNGYATVKYLSRDPNIIKVSEDGTSFQGVGLGEALIIAIQDSDRVYEAPDPIQKKFLVTDKLLQYILWEDNLTDFCIGDAPDTLRAQVWVMTDAANGTWEYSPERTAKLQYSSPNVNIATITDSILTIVEEGEMFIEATVPASDTYEMAKAQIPVRVRDCSVQCTDADLIIPVINSDGETMMPEDKFEYNPYLGQTQKIVKIDRNYGIPGHLIFAYYGRQAWGTLAGKIRVWESTDNQATWQQVLSDAEALTPLAQQTQYSPYIPLSRNATHIKFERYDHTNLGYHLIQYITITPAQYIESIPDDVDFGNIYVGNTVDTTIAITYSSIRSNLQLSSSYPSHLTIDKTTIEDECGAWDTIPLTISLKADISVVGAFNQYVLVEDPLGGIIDTIHVTANIVKNTPTITWTTTTDTIRSSAEWELQKTATSSSGDKVLYEIHTGNNEYAYLNDQGKMILLRGGTITARAYTPETTTSNEVSNYHDFFIIVDPLFEDFDNDSNWLNDNNWNIGRQPWTTDSATIQAGKTVILKSHITTQGLEFEAGSFIHITSTGGLTVGEQGITNAAANGSSIIIDNLKSGIGFLRISPLYTDTMPPVTVNYQTRSTLDTGANRDATWQYIGAPGANTSFTVDYITWLYLWNEQKGWQQQTGTLTFQPFAGYAITQYGKPTYALIANPINTNQTIQLTKTATNGGMDGDNLFANSFMAPIDVKNFTKEDFKGDMDMTFYIFNSGSWNQWNGQNEKDSTIGGNGSTTPGQYCAIPALSTTYLDSKYDITTLPPMQGIYVVAHENGATIQLDYNKHVWQAGSSTKGTTNMNEPMRAPQRATHNTMQRDDFLRMRLQVNSANSGADRLYIIQEHTTTRQYDNGYDAPNQFAEGITNIYTNEPFGKMEVSCANNIDSMYIGFQAGTDSEYTLSYRSLIGESLYLKDLTNDSIFLLTEGGQYHFTQQPKSTNDLRFQVLLHPSFPDEDPNTGNGDITTDIHDIMSMQIWHNNHQLYITNAPANSVAKIYAISGQFILTSHIQQSTHTIDIHHLQRGVYILQVNNQRYKFVCQ